uniref:ANK_REP_REGION domain-containing protein n=1 Tax=Parastrongyloides trichosuri TaxID=131310 RepID=A0A0N4ZDH1_PARTI
MKLLSAESYNFLRDCEEGDFISVKRFIEIKLKKKDFMKTITNILNSNQITPQLDLCKYKYTSNGHNPLHLAIISGNMTLIRYLIKMDSKLLYDKDKEGKIPFHLISHSKNKDIWKEISQTDEFIYFLQQLYN